RECPRKYYFNYYGSWGGWKFDAPERTRQIYMLKQLKNRYMWIGEVVHACVERSLLNIYQGAEVPDQEEIVQRAREMMQDGFRSSRRKRYLSKPKTCALFEHEYNIDVDEEEWERLFDYAERCLRNFCQSQFYRELPSLPRESWLEIEQFSHFWLDKVKIYVTLDFACRKGEEVFIYDWKTGKGGNTESDNIQLACYALYAMEKWGVSTADIRTIEYNLARDEMCEFPVNEEIIKGVEEYIKESISSMKAVLRDEAQNEAVETDFRKTANKNVCRQCNFRKICTTIESNSQSSNLVKPEEPKTLSLFNL
ncbi:MAG: PD-(D/E)XK nuclease family protein, partial [Caldiserica bacterium]|nr:PD-(D/E)XK nuclease family protein [Caldisericota bacterium]